MRISANGKDHLRKEARNIGRAANELREGPQREVCKTIGGYVAMIGDVIETKGM